MSTSSKHMGSLAVYLPFVLVSGIVFAHGVEKHGHKESHLGTTPREKENLESINEEYRFRVQPIFKRSCFDCHSSRTSYPWYSDIPGVKKLIQNDVKEARSHLDLSNDFPFSGHGTPRTDLEAIRNEINEGAMPPMRYSFLHPGSELTNEEKKIVLEWIVTSLSKIPAPREPETLNGH